MTPRRENFLVIQLRQIGDVVLTTPIPHILKEARPGCRLVFLTERPSEQLLDGNPYIDEVVISDRKGTMLDSLRLAAALRRRRFDVVLDFMGNPRSALLARLSGAPMRVSYPAAGRGLLYTHRVPPEKRYAVEIKKSLLRPLGITSPLDRAELYLTDAEREAGKVARGELLAGFARRLVTVDPSHRRATRRWPAEHYGRLCRLVRDGLGALPAVLWGPGEEELADAVVAASEGAAVMAPPTGLREMAALIGAADLHVGNCSAPRHIAVAVGTPTFTVLGSTSEGWTHPAIKHTQIALGLDCQPCNRNQCDRDRECLIRLEPQVVFDRLSGWVRQTLGWGA
jgi:heptosyltransferase-2/heptosyltransferase-3